MSTPAVYLDSISLLGPGLPDWQTACAILRGSQPYAAAPLQVAAPAALPATERRRAGLAVKLSMAVGLAAVQQAGATVSTLANVFSSTGGDCDNCHSLLEALAAPERMVSPTRFHNSVHNAPAGYWSIATGCTAASTSLSAYDATFGAGLLEAAGQVLASGQPCLLVAFDTPYPEPLHSKRPIPGPMGLGMVLSAAPGPLSLAALRLTLGHTTTGEDVEAALRVLPAAVARARRAALASSTAGPR